MGLLSTIPSGGESEAEAPAEGSEEGGEAAAEQEAAPEPQKPVALAPEPKRGRRAEAAAAQARYEAELRELREKVTSMPTEYQRQLSERDAEIARLKGSFETYQRMATTQAQQAAKPTAQDLHTKALEALKDGKFDDYDRLNRQSIIAEIEEKQPRQERQAAQPQGFDPRLQAVVMSTPAAQRVLANERGMQMALVADQELATVYNIPDGPDRWRKAFELAEQRLGTPGKTNGFSANGKQMLSGVGHAGSGTASGGKGTPHVQLPQGWEAWAKAAGMTRDEYARAYADANPDKVTDGE